MQIKTLGFSALFIFALFASTNSYASVWDDANHYIDTHKEGWKVDANKTSEAVKKSSQSAYEKSKAYINAHKGEWKEDAIKAKDALVAGSKSAYDKTKSYIQSK